VVFPDFYQRARFMSMKLRASSLEESVVLVNGIKSRRDATKLLECRGECYHNLTKSFPIMRVLIDAQTKVVGIAQIPQLSAQTTMTVVNDAKMARPTQTQSMVE
jgi:hypothetical protein